MITLNNIPGQTIVARNLLNSFNRGRLASTYLFYGSDGQGKWATAIAFAALVNCENPLRDKSGRVLGSCRECRNCRQIANLSFSDLYFALPLPPYKNEKEFNAQYLEYLDQKRTEPYRIISSARQQTIPVEMAYEIRKKISIKHEPGIKRIILFYQMEKMLPASADALLKMIEEPPPETIIIMTAVDPDDLLPTIKSRAQRVRFLPLPAEEITRYLAERRDIGQEKASLAAHLADGSLGHALSFIDDENDSSHRQTSFLLFKNILTKDSPSAIAALSELVNPNDRGESEQIIQRWQSFLSDIIRIKHGERLTDIINLDLARELETISARINSPADFAGILDNLKKMTLSLRRNIHIRTGMSALALRLRRYVNQTP